LPRRFVYTGGLSLAVLAADLVTKELVRSCLTEGMSQAVAGEFIKLTFIYNRNAVFGLPVGHPTVYLVLSLAALGLIIWYFFNLKPEQRAEQLALAAIIGGAVGNQCDRFRWGQVVDFIEIGYRQYTWPIFNVADVAITAGLCVLVYRMLFKQDKNGNRDERKM
jgi:signal peptidase II